MSRNRILAFVASLAIAVGAVGASASAITDGNVDGQDHPNVGMLLFYTAEGRFRCTGTLVSPTVVLTAAHCTDGTLGKTMVTFDTTIALQSPSGLPEAKNPSKGFSGTRSHRAASPSRTALRTRRRATRTSPTSPTGTTMRWSCSIARTRRSLPRSWRRRATSTSSAPTSSTPRCSRSWDTAPRCASPRAARRHRRRSATR